MRLRFFNRCIIANYHVFFSGLGLTAASVPVLVSAYYYRNKAKKIGLSMGIAQLSTPSLRQNISYTPAMNFTITF